MFDHRLKKVVFVLMFLGLSGAANADRRLSMGWSQWGLFDEFDIGTFKATYEFGEMPKIWDTRIGVSIFYGLEDEYYVSVGWMKEWNINSNWSWGLGGDAGYFSGDILGNEVEFYTRGILNYHISQTRFIRAEVGHISNAGFGENNPGSENLALSYTWVF